MFFVADLVCIDTLGQTKLKDFSGPPAWLIFLPSENTDRPTDSHKEI